MQKEKISKFEFKMMEKLGMPIRDFFMPPKKMLAETEIRQGMHVLDFGCGPGTFSIALADQVGPEGQVYSLDVHPLALKTVEKKARNKNIKNIKTLLSDCDIALPDTSLNLIIFFDVFHEVQKQQEVLKELHRVMKPDANMCFSDHHMKEQQILDIISPRNGLFKLTDKGKRTFSFKKEQVNG
jgi:ubiquinone/menaquinone biosynthesis C-methylase UbiE